MRFSLPLSLSLSTLNKIKNIIDTKLYPQIKKFDVTMSNGLASIPKIYTLDEKKVILKKIMNVYKPHSLEIGSLVSPKVVPQMKQSYELYNYANKLYNKKTNVCDFYLVVPPTKHYLDIAQKLNIRNISLYTSVSEAFHKQSNTQSSLRETKTMIKEFVKKPNNFDKVKLYVSCIPNCPIKGKQDKEHIINELYEYLHIDGISEVCLTNTCDTMRYSEFIHIIDYLNIEMNYKLEKLSLHLHINQNENKYYTLDNIIEYAITNNIIRFDLTSFENIYFGNSIIKVDIKQFNRNLTYDRLYESIYDTIIYRIK